MTLRIARLDERARLPTRAHDGDAGLDLYALEDGVLAPGERAAVATGIAVEIPPGQAGLVLPRSGRATVSPSSTLPASSTPATGARSASCC
jgi:dUTP pyrophosphatase